MQKSWSLCSCHHVGNDYSMPVQAEKPKTPTSFEEKKEQKLGKAEAKLKKAQARVDCIKAATEMKALKQCK